MWPRRTGALRSARNNPSVEDFRFFARFSAARLGTMGKRREARERAVQFLFQQDLNPPEDLDAALEHFWETQRGAAIAEEKGTATWGQPVELPPPTADEAAVRLFSDPLIKGKLEYR